MSQVVQRVVMAAAGAGLAVTGVVMLGRAGWWHRKRERIVRKWDGLLRLAGGKVPNQKEWEGLVELGGWALLFTGGLLILTALKL